MPKASSIATLSLSNDKVGEMRKSEEEFFQQLPMAGEASDEMLWYTVWLAFLIGVALTGLSWNGRQWWLFTWSVGLIICSILYLGWSWFAGRAG